MGEQHAQVAENWSIVTVDMNNVGLFIPVHPHVTLSEFAGLLRQYHDLHEQEEAFLRIGLRESNIEINHGDVDAV